MNDIKYDEYVSNNVMKYILHLYETSRAEM